MLPSGQFLHVERLLGCEALEAGSEVILFPSRVVEIRGCPARIIASMKLPRHGQRNDRLAQRNGHKWAAGLRTIRRNCCRLRSHRNRGKAKQQDAEKDLAHAVMASRAYTESRFETRYQLVGKYGESILFP